MTETDIQAAPKQSASEIAARFQTLSQALLDQKDTADLFKLANSPDFKAVAHTLNEVQLRRLRELYVERKNDLDGKTRLETFNGQVIVISDIQFWHTDKYDNNDGNGVTLTYHPEADPQRRCRSMTTSSIVYRFATNMCDPMPPTPSEPIRVHIELVPVRDPDRAAKGQKQWKFRLLPPVNDANGSEGSPF